MKTIEVPGGVEARVEGETVVIKGKLGSTAKRINARLMQVRSEPGKLVVDGTKNRKLAKKAELAMQAFSSELSSAVNGVQNGVETKMVIFFSHFPLTLEIKDKSISIKNIFGERVARTARIVGDTKVEVKGQEVTVKGVDPYDVGQTVANIRTACYPIGDTRIFQDGVYIAKAE